MIGRLLDKVKLWHIIACAAAAYLLALTRTLSLNGDDATYILLSRAFIEKGVAGHLFSPEFARAGLYNFLLPLLLAPFSMIAPDNFLLMKAIPLISSVVAIIALDAFLKGSVSERLRKAIVLLFAFNPWVVQYSGLILTEMPFIAASLSSLACSKKYEESEKGVYLLFFVLSTAFAFYLRPFGIALIPALVLMFAARRQYKQLGAVACALFVLLLPFFHSAASIFSFVLRESFMRQELYSATYRSSSLLTALYRVGYNLAAYTGNYLPDILLRPLAENIYPRLPSGNVNPVFIPKFILGISASLVIARGFIKTAADRMGLQHWYVLCYSALALLINIYVARYLLPLLPLLLIFFFSGLSGTGGIREGSDAFRRRAISFSFAILFAVSITGVAFQVVEARTGNMPPEERNFIECNDWIKANVPAATVVLSRKPSYTKLYTGRMAVGYLHSEDARVQLEHIKKMKPGYVIVGDLGFYVHSAKAVKEVVLAHPELFSLVYETKKEPVYYVYKVMADRL